MTEQYVQKLDDLGSPGDKRTKTFSLSEQVLMSLNNCFRGLD